MKRKRSSFTLWDAAKVDEHKSMWHWWQSIRRKTFRNDKISDCDVELLLESTQNKKQLVTEKFLTTFSVGLRPTKSQRKVLNEMLKVTNYTYNWCLHLVNEMHMKARQYDLQKIVCKTNASDIEAQYRLPNDAWFFENKMSSIKLTACKNFCASYKSAKALKSKQLRPRTVENNILEGSFEIQKLYVRILTQKDFAKLENFPSQKYLCIMPDNFSCRKNPKERFLKIASSIHKLPPIEHDVKVVKRANGKFVLQIPCDPKYTRTKHSNRSRICGIDPGGRTFATVYDPVDCFAFQVGLEEDKQFVIRKLHDKIDAAHTQLTFAQQNKKELEQRERVRQIKKLHLKVKTFVNDIHLKLSSFLVKEYKYVALGKISVSNIVRKDRPNHLAKRANRDLLCWQHYRFRERLKNRVVMTDCEVVVQNEAYTSKTCSLCGKVNKNLGSKETFICENCDYQTHRDINGAKNILLKSLNMFPFSPL